MSGELHGSDAGAGLDGDGIGGGLGLADFFAAVDGNLVGEGLLGQGLGGTIEGEMEGAVVDRDEGEIAVGDGEAGGFLVVKCTGGGWRRRFFAGPYPARGPGAV